MPPITPAQLLRPWGWAGQSCPPWGTRVGPSQTPRMGEGRSQLSTPRRRLRFPSPAQRTLGPVSAPGSARPGPSSLRLSPPWSRSHPGPPGPARSPLPRPLAARAAAAAPDAGPGPAMVAPRRLRRNPGSGRSAPRSGGSLPLSCFLAVGFFPLLLIVIFNYF